MKKFRLALVGVFVTLGLLTGMFAIANAESDYPLGFDSTEIKMSPVYDGDTACIFGPGKYGVGNAWFVGGWNENDYSNVEIWFTGTEMGGSYPVVPGFNSPKLIKTGSYTARHLEGLIVNFFNYMPQASTEHTIIFDTNINGSMDTAGMESCTWTSSTDGNQQYMPVYKDYNTDFYKNVDTYYYSVCSKNTIGGKYQVGGGCRLDTAEVEIYMYYQYWKNGNLVTIYMDQVGYADQGMNWSAEHPIVTSRMEANKMALFGTVGEVAGRTYYIAFDTTLDGSHNAGSSIEVPLP